MTWYCYSTNEEDYYGAFGTREQAAYAACESLVGLKSGRCAIWTGKSVVRGILDYFDADSFIEALGERAWEDTDGAEDWLYAVSDAAKEDLRKRVDAWADEHGLQPDFGVVDEIEQAFVEVPS